MLWSELCDCSVVTGTIVTDPDNNGNWLSKIMLHLLLA